jgi:hypothetical protein
MIKSPKELLLTGEFSPLMGENRCLSNTQSNRCRFTSAASFFLSFFFVGFELLKEEEYEGFDKIVPKDLSVFQTDPNFRS